MLNKAYINLSAIRENAEKVKEILPETAKLCAVVKADAYGHGAVKTASALYGVADCFAVALVEEGIELRLGGIDKDILVLNRAFGEDIERAAAYDLTLTAVCTADLALAAKESRKQGKTVKVHVKYNTGMNRQGADSVGELKKMLNFAKENPGVYIDGIYSHYAMPENKVLREAATNKFSVAKRLVKEYNSKATAHISASGGFLCGEYFDMVRIGILLYGYKPFASDKIQVTPAMKVIAPVMCSKVIEQGESALYGECFAEKNTRIFVIRYGYADGLPRREICGQYNNRCMDLTAVTGLDKNAKSAEVLSDAEELAKKYGTISYEILTKAALRAEKIYLD